MKLYRTGLWNRSKPIEEFESPRQTEHFAYDERGNRVKWISEWARIHKSFDEAKSYLIDKAETTIAAYRQKLERELEYLEKVKGL